MKKILLIAAVISISISAISCQGCGARLKQDGAPQQGIAGETRDAKEAIVGTWHRKGTRAVEVFTDNPEISKLITNELNLREPYNYSGVEGSDIYIFEGDGTASTTLGGDIMHKGKYTVEGKGWKLELPVKTVEGEISARSGILSVFYDETASFQRKYPDAGVKKIISAWEYMK